MERRIDAVLPGRPSHGRRWLLLCAALALFACAVSAEETERLAEVMGLKPGMVVADVGAGDGRWSEKLAGFVGEEGHVYATEIDDDDVERMKDRFADAELGNVTAVLGRVDDTGLPEGCCDVILLRMVYHHFTEPEKMRRSLHRSLRPGGLLVVVDITPQKGWRQLPDVPERGGHGIAPEALVEELTKDCFHLVERRDEWDGKDDRYLAVFRR